jgi:hypothetical protein
MLIIFVFLTGTRRPPGDEHKATICRIDRMCTADMRVVAESRRALYKAQETSTTDLPVGPQRIHVESPIQRCR